MKQAGEAKSERAIQNEIEIYCSQQGWLPLRLNSGVFYQGTNIGDVLVNLRIVKGLPEGTPDLLVLKPLGECLWVECKTLRGRQRECQKRFEKAIAELGHKYIVARCIEDIKKQG